MKAIKLFIIAIVLCLPYQLIAEDIDTSCKVYFYTAKQHIENMLSGEEPLSYEKAIFEIENAWAGGTINYLTFKQNLACHEGRIKKLVDAHLDKNKLVQTDGYDGTKEQKVDRYKKLLLNYAIYRYMTTVSLWIGEDSILWHNPYRYSSKDPMGTNNWTNTQVTALLNEGSGNCFALSSLFKIFSDRLNSDAKLCTAPGHIYIRHADEKGTQYNIELGSHAFPGTGTIETITYTSNEAVKNKIALRELNDKQAVALCLVYLAKGYEFKFSSKNGEFQLQCAELALKYDEYNLNAMLLKAELMERSLVNQRRSINELQSQKDFKDYQRWINNIFLLGYREMPYDMKNILIKGWTKDTIVQLALIDHTPKRLKNTKIQQTRYASLSWGLFDEEIETKPMERFGNTIFDTKHKRIVAFVNDDILYNGYYFDPVVFAYNIDPLAHKFPGQSPYSSFGGNPIYNVDVGGAYQYPAKLVAAYTKDYAMITKYLAENVQYDIKKSNIVQTAVTTHSNGGYSKQDLIWKVAAWNNKESPTITFEEGLTKRTGGLARAQTLNQHNIHIDADYARSVEKILGSDNSTQDEKQSAMLQFYQTLLDETTHTGDFKKNNGYSSGGEVGGDAVNEIYYSKRVKTDDGQTIDVFNPASDKEIYEQKTKEGKSEVLPTLPKKGK